MYRKNGTEIKGITVINTQHIPRRFWRRMNNLGFAFMVAMFSLLFGDESLAVTKSSITVEFKVDNNLLQYTPSESFKNTLNKYTCDIAKKHWGFLNWCCETGECTQETDKAVWMVKLEAKKSENSSLVSWHINHFVNSEEIEPDYFAQNELYNSVAIKPVTSDRESQKELFLKIIDKIKNQFEIEAFRNKATDLLLNFPVAHELDTVEDNRQRKILTLPFRHCDLKLEKGGGSDWIPTFTVHLNLNNDDVNRLILEKTGLVPENENMDGYIKGKEGYIKGQVIGWKIAALEIPDRPISRDMPIKYLDKTILNEVLENVDNVYMDKYRHDPGAECSVPTEGLAEGLVLSNPVNMVSTPLGSRP